MKFSGTAALLVAFSLSGGACAFSPSIISGQVNTKARMAPLAMAEDDEVILNRWSR